MTEQGSKQPPEMSVKKSALPEQTRKFIQFASDNGITEILDERRRKTLLEYAFNDQMSFNSLKTSIGMSTEGTRLLYHQALKTIWEASPPEVQQQYPKEVVLVGKPRARKATPEKKAKIKKALLGSTHSEATKRKRNAAIREKLGTEDVKHKMSAAQRDRQRREKEARKVVFSSASKIQDQPK